MDILPSAPDYATFLAQYLIPNRPCMFRGRLIEDWQAYQEWTQVENGIRRPNLGKLKHLYGHLMVTVIEFALGDTLSTSEVHSSTRKSVEMKFSKVIERWEAPFSSGVEGYPPTKLYVKDWHLPKLLESAGDQPCSFYNTPDIFLDDWMNQYYTAETDDDFRFVYIGEQGTYTALHADVYSSYSWSANILGQKCWNLYQPGSSELITIIQSEGEVVFVPSGWKHEVENLSPLVISINHNWCNSVNLPCVYDSLSKDDDEVQDSIMDVKEIFQKRPRKRFEPCWESEWIEVVQDMLRKHAGWDWTTFWKMVHFVTRHTFDIERPSPAIGLDRATRLPLAPSGEFIAQQVHYCISKFETRKLLEHIEGLALVLIDIKLWLKETGKLSERGEPLLGPQQ